MVIDAVQATAGESSQYQMQRTIIKYLGRYRHKGDPLTDPRKARWYLDRLIKEYQ